MCLLAVLGSQGIVIKCTSAMLSRTVDQIHFYFLTTKSCQYILDSETEWAQNKKLIERERRDSVRVFPRDFLSYFSVEFRLNGGFAHVNSSHITLANKFSEECWTSSREDMEKTAKREF